jgi:CRISPR-associated protein Csb1
LLAAKEGTTGSLSTDRTKALREYIFGLALVAFTHNPPATCGRAAYSCGIRRANENEFVEVYPTGRRTPVTITHDQALEYATAAAKLSASVSKTVPFDPGRAKKDVKGKATPRRSRRRAARAKGKPTEEPNAD